MSLPDFLIHAGEVLGAAAVIAASFKFILLPIRRFFRGVKSHFEKIEVIYKEVRPNGGSSLKDTVNHLKATVTKIEKRQRAWLSHSEGGVFETDESGSILWANRAFLKLLNATFEEVEGAGWKNFVSEGCRAQVFAAWNSAFHDKRDFKSSFFVQRGEGTELAVSVDGYAIKEEGAKVAGYVFHVTRRESGEGFCGR